MTSCDKGDEAPPSPLKLPPPPAQKKPCPPPPRSPHTCAQIFRPCSGADNNITTRWALWEVQ